MAMMIVTDCNVTGTKNEAGVLDQEIKKNVANAVEMVKHNVMKS
jgi:hypothetical protein